jgi:tetratricopeptide (TPR) repeat protein
MQKLTLLLVLAFVSSSREALAQEHRLAEMRETARAAPQDPQAALALGRTLRRAGHYAEALAELRRGLSLPAGRSGASATALRYEVARVYIDDHRFREAIGACQALGKTAEGHACLAAAHMTRRRATDAMPEVELALAAAPSLYDARVVEADAKWMEGSGDEAEQILKAAIDAEPRRVEARLKLGDVYAARGKREQALEAFQAARAADPDDPDAAFAVGDALGPSPAAVTHLEAAVAGRPSFGAAWARLAEVRLSLGRVPEAEKAALTALKIDGKQADWHVVLARVYHEQKRNAEALAEARAALKLLPNLAAAKLIEADLLAEQGEIDPALEAYQAAFGLARTDPNPLVHAARACLVAGRGTSAKAFAARVTQQFPQFGPGWVVLGDAMAKDKELATARQAYETALNRDGVDREEVRRKLAALR